MTLSLSKIIRIAKEFDEASRSPWNQRIQANILSAAFAVTIFMNLTFVIVSAWHWHWTSVAIQGVVLIGLIYGAYLLFKIGDAVRALSVMAWMLLPALIYRTYKMGGAESPSLPSVIIGFTLFALILPVRRALFFSALYLFVILAFVAVEYSGVHLKSTMPADVQEAFRVFNIISIVFVIFWMVFKFRHAHTLLANEMVEQRDRRAMLFRVLAHDLSTPLMILGGELERMKSNDQSVQRMMSAFGQVEEIIARAKSIEVAGTHGHIVVPDFVDLSEAIESSIDRIRPRAKEKDVHFHFEARKDDVVVAFNRSSLVYHVLENVFNNALKFSPRGGFVEIKILEQKMEWQVVVQDQGPGFLPAMIHRLKNSDSSVRRMGTEGESGSGLGLLIVDAVMKVYGGHLEVESLETANPGKGGRVILSFHKGLPTGRSSTQ